MNKESTKSNVVVPKKNNLGTSIDDVLGIPKYYFLVQVLIVLATLLTFSGTMAPYARIAVIIMSFGLVLAAISFNIKFIRYMHVLCYMFILIIHLFALVLL